MDFSHQSTITSFWKVASLDTLKCFSIVNFIRGMAERKRDGSHCLAKTNQLLLFFLYLHFVLVHVIHRSAISVFCFAFLSFIFLSCNISFTIIILIIEWFVEFHVIFNHLNVLGPKDCFS